MTLTPKQHAFKARVNREIQSTLERKSTRGLNAAVKQRERRANLKRAKLMFETT
jgi:hypothetical protein